MIFDNQLRHAIRIMDTYPGDQPLHAWLKDYFRAHKQMGSRDRRQLSTLVYSFYRTFFKRLYFPFPLVAFCKTSNC